ncbi:aminotransferase class V-fold PLP-dependent enzyme [Nocardioides sp. MAH-18]|uniref:Aminotransferase class V-fold PLP-dependent enzyme n=1 Tax=Nocardioides agri TaxID=2682843 RepID=A0A6L6XL03_9ACTN|nr:MULTISPECIES: aminotransferase class V-fold PLP-dependent enzyme [unclassified Nocardioides]MBA2953029.1 aminotransferase class V-fold PLP-dependent enzyme [Nocardioides sp. CGMCC 1.13656]MVQ47899.1 aminotransferase class V-fold PLP-dependent enzyme [Nocardioides sp. MAH-18]
MPLSTRRALLGAGLAGGAALVVGCDDDAEPPGPAVATAAPSAPPAELTVPDFDPGDWASVRAQFPLDPDAAQFAAFVLSPHTAQVDAAVSFHRAQLGWDTEQALLDGIELEDAVRAAAAAYAGGAAGEYALTDSTTMGLGIVYGGLALTARDEVLSTTHDFFSTEDALRLLTLRTGARVRRVSLYDDPAAATVDEMVDRLVRGLTPRTRVVAITWVHSSTGVRTPVREIADALPDGVLLCVDGVHGFAAVDVDLPDLGCDFLSAGTHKWLFGPRGTGIVWGRNWGPLTEIIPSFTPQGPAGRLTPGGYHSFEHRWALAEGFAFQQRIGRAAVVERTVEQATRLKEGLAGSGVTVVTPLDPAVSAGIVCLDVPGTPPGNAVLELREHGVVASATPYATSYLRLGPSIVTSPDEVDAAVAAVSGLV